MSKHYYETSLQHLLAELKRMDLLIIAEVEISRQQVTSESPPDEDVRDFRKRN